MEFTLILNMSATDTCDLFLGVPYNVVPYITILGVAAVMGTLGNILVIGAIALMTHKQCHEASNIFMVNLAISDILVTAFIDPFSIVGKYGSNKGYYLVVRK